MKQKIVWFIFGILLGSMFLVYADRGFRNSCKCSTNIEELHASGTLNYTIKGPYNLTPREVMLSLPLEGAKILNKKIQGAKHIATFPVKGAYYSIFQKSSNPLTDSFYVIWDKNGIKEIDKLKFKILEEKMETKASGKETFYYIKAQVSNVGALSTVYVITAEYTYTWSIGDAVWSKTVAKGTFWVDYGNKILSVNDLSYEYHPWGVIKCSFSSHTSGVGTVSAGVYADASYMFWDLLSPVAAHWDAHSRVFVDAWTNINGYGWGNKWIGGPWC